jgi:hypothetical protein
MSEQSRSSRRFRVLILEAGGRAFLVPGFFLLSKSALEVVVVQHVTTNFLYCSSAGLLLMLIGLLMNSCQKEFKFSPPNPG